MKRRSFIESSIAASVVCALGSKLSRFALADAGTHRITRLGLQLYTVRGALKKNFEGTLEKVAATGYKEVEFAGYFNHPAKEIRAMLDRHGLVSPSEHVDYAVVEKKWPEQLDDAHTLGHSYLVCPWVDEAQRKEADGWKRAVELFNRAGETSQKAGIQFAYHNHAFEFDPSEALAGKMPYDFLLAQTDPKLVQMEMDLCWITVGGQDPLKYFEQYPGRFPLVHVKDWARSSPFASDLGGAKPSAARQGHMTAVGAGNIDWKRIFAQSEKAGIKHYFVENDEPKSPFDDIRASFKYLNALRF